MMDLTFFPMNVSVCLQIVQRAAEAIEEEDGEAEEPTEEEFAPEESEEPMEEYTAKEVYVVTDEEEDEEDSEAEEPTEEFDEALEEEEFAPEESKEPAEEYVAEEDGATALHEAGTSKKSCLLIVKSHERTALSLRQPFCSPTIGVTVSSRGTKKNRF
jgi:hypothetical protein